MLNQQEQFFRQINQAKKIAIVFEKSWRGDSVASALALSQLLKKLGKEAMVLADPAEQNKICSWLPGFAEIQTRLPGADKFIISLDLTNARVEQLNYQTKDQRLDFIITPAAGFFTAADVTSRASGFAYDLIIALNSPDLATLGELYQTQPDFFFQTPLINIDRDPANENYGQINLLNLQAVAGAEIIFNLFAEQAADLMDADSATCLLAGLIMQTNNFKTGQLTPQALQLAAELMKLGGRREDIVDRLYRNKQLTVLKLWGQGLVGLAAASDNKIVWTTLNYQQLLGARAKRDDLIAMIDELIINLPQAEVVILFIDKNEQTTALIYALKNFDASALLKKYQGQGDKKLAQITLNRPLTEVVQELVPAVSRMLS